MNEYLKIVLTEMCNRVQADFNSIDFKQIDWYYKYEWTQEEEDSFIKWLSNYLYETPKARQVLYELRSKSKKLCEKAANGFRFYCWKLKKESDETI